MYTKFARRGIRPINGEWIYFASSTGEFLIRQQPRYHIPNHTFGSPYHRPAHRFQLFLNPVLARVYNHPTRRIRATI